MKAPILVAAVLVVGVIGWRLARPPALYRVTMLPSLGGWACRVYSLNDRNQVVGVEHMEGEEQRLFLWDRHSGIQDLGHATGDQLMINNGGQISGTMAVDPNGRQAFLWEPGKGRTMLGTLGGKTSVALVLNNRGQIIGLAYDACNRIHAFLWDRQMGMKKLMAPDGRSCWPQGISDTGQILVMSIKQPLTSSDWFVLNPNGSKSLDAVPPGTSLRSMNAHGCMVGVDESSSSKPHLLFWDEQGSLKRLFPVGVHATLTRLNDKNQLAYSEFSSSLWERLQYRFLRRRWTVRNTVSHLWDPVRGRIPLNRYVRGMRGFHAVDLNNNGCIVGTGEGQDGRTRSLLLEPIPERWGER